jgi:hypothetical protein
MSTTPMRDRIAQRLQRIGAAPARRAPSRPDRQAAAPERPAPPPQPLGPEARVREAGGPEDRASYTCPCGMAFSALVSTSVSCPRCGTDQAW